MALYALVDITIQGPGGDETLLFSNLPYKADSGPNAGIWYRASWESGSFDGLTIDKSGIDAQTSGLITPSGVVGPKISDVVVLNDYPTDPTLTGATRELDYIFDPDFYVLEGQVTVRLGESGIDGTMPLWSDLKSCFVGSISGRPEKSNDGSTVKWSFESTVKDLDTPLLSEFFTGMGGYADAFSINAMFTDNTIHSGDWSVQFYAGLSNAAAAPTAIPLNSVYSAWQVLGEEYRPLVFIYRDNANLLRMKVFYADNDPDPHGLSEFYTLWDMSGLDYTDLKFVTVVWSETSGLVKTYVGNEEVSSQAINNNMGRGVEGRLQIPNTAGAIPIRFSTLRRYGDALTASQVSVTTRPLDYGSTEEPVSLLTDSWEFERQSGNTVVNYLDGPDIVTLGDPFFVWGSAADGGPNLYNSPIPAVIGDCFNVPLTETSGRLHQRVVGTSIQHIFRVHSQGVSLQKDVEPGIGVWRVDGAADTIRARSVTPEIFGPYTVDGQEMTLDGTYAGTYTVDEVTPNLYSNIRKPGSSAYSMTLSLGGLTPDTLNTAEVATLSTNSDYADWIDTTRVESPYGTPSNTDTPIVQLVAAKPDPLTADVVGDPDILSANPPSGYKPPGMLDNALMQMLTKYGPKWTTQVNTPDYGSIPNRVGFVASDKISTRDAVNAVAKGCLTWVDEGGDGKVTFRKLKFPEELTPVMTLTQGSVSSVKRVKRKGGSPEKLEGFNVGYNRCWQVIDKESIPDAASVKTRDFVTKEWRTIPIGSLNAARDSPTLLTHELQQGKAEEIGNSVLRLSSGTSYVVKFRVAGIDSVDKVDIGDRVDIDLPDFGLPNKSCLVASIRAQPSAGLLTLNLWLEEA